MAQLMKPDPLSPQKPYLFTFAKYAKLKPHQNTAGFLTMVSQNISNNPFISQIGNPIKDRSSTSQKIQTNLDNNPNLSQASLSQRTSSNLSNYSNFQISTQGSSGAASQRTVSSFRSKAPQIQQEVKIPLLNLQPFSLSSFIVNQNNNSMNEDPSQSQPKMRKIKGIAKSTEKLRSHSSIQSYQCSLVSDLKGSCTNETIKQEQEINHPTLNNSLVLVQVPNEIEITTQPFLQKNQESQQLQKNESKCSPAELQECQYLHDLIANIASPQTNTHATTGNEEYQYLPSSIKKIPLSAERFNGVNTSCPKQFSYSERNYNKFNVSNCSNSQFQEQQPSSQNSFSSQGIQISPFFADSGVSKTKDKFIPISQLFLKNETVIDSNNGLRQQQSRLGIKSNKKILAKLTKNSRDLSPFIRIENKTNSLNYPQPTLNSTDGVYSKQKQFQSQLKEGQQNISELTPNSASYKSFCFYKTSHNKMQKTASASGIQVPSSSMCLNKSSFPLRNLSLKDTSIKIKHLKNISEHLIEQNLWELIDKKG